MEKKNNGLVIVLVLIILCLGGFILYDKNVFGLKGDNKDNTNNQEVNNSKDKTEEEIKIGSVGNKESKIELKIDKDAYFNIKDGKVVFHKKDGTEITDSTIPDKVIQIAYGTSCDGYDVRIAALTEKGEVYHNKNVYLKSSENNDYIYSFDFIKVASDGKVYGIDAVDPNVFHTCFYTELYAYVSKDEMREIVLEQDYINISSDGQRNILSASLGHTYNELYPYEKYYIIFNLDGPMLYKAKDGKLYFEKGRKTANEDMYLTINGNFIYADEVYLKSSNDTQEERIIVDKNKKVYLLTISKLENVTMYQFKYKVENTNKEFKSVKEEKNDKGTTNYTLEYTDGTSEIVY